MKSGRLRGVRQAGRFDDGQRIHVGANADDASVRVAPPPDQPDHPDAPDPLLHLVAAEFAQFRRDNRGRAPGVVEELRMLVEIAPPGGDLVLHFRNSVLDRHGLALRSN